MNAIRKKNRVSHRSSEKQHKKYRNKEIRRQKQQVNFLNAKEIHGMLPVIQSRENMKDKVKRGVDKRRKGMRIDQATRKRGGYSLRLLSSNSCPVWSKFATVRSWCKMMENNERKRLWKRLKEIKINTFLVVFLFSYFFYFHFFSECSSCVT